MRRRRRKIQDEYIAELNLAYLIDIMTRNQTMPNRHRYLPPPPAFHVPQRRNNGPVTRQRSSRCDPYRVPPRQNFFGPERSFIDMLEEKRTAMNSYPIHNSDGIHLDQQSHGRIPTSPPQNITAPRPSSHSSSPPQPPAPPAPPVKPPTAPTDPWRIQYCIEKERLSPRDSKPSSLLFFTETQEKTTRESKHNLRKITNLYPHENLFGLGAPTKVHLRQVQVTFSQIWNRHVIIERWKRQGQDPEGYLVFEDQEFKIQLQRHHVPGTLFFAPEAGDLSINDPSMIAPDVCFRMVDVPGQDFTRSESCEYDLKRMVEVEEGQLEASLFGIDGREIKFEIEGRKFVRVEGEGMPRNWEGTDRGDLLIEIVVQ